MINYRTYPAIMALTITLATYSAAIICSFFWPEICWLPRIGGLLVGMSLVIQGYVEVNPEKFSVPWRWGLNRRQVYLHFSMFAAVFGTIIWTFGDLFPKVLWITNTSCTG